MSCYRSIQENRMENSITVKTSRKVIEASLAYTAGNILLKGISFLSIPIFARILSQEDFGIFSTFMAYESILFIVIGVSIHSSIKNAKYEFTDSLDHYVSSITVISILNMLLLLGLSNAFAGPLGKVTGFSWAILNLLVLHSFSSAIITVYNARIILDYNYKSYLKLALFNCISNIALSVLLCLTLFKNTRYLGRIMGLSLPVILISLIILFLLYRKKRPSFQRKYFKFALNYSIPMVPDGISQCMLSSFDRILIRNMFGNMQAGIYSFAYNINLIYVIIASSLSSVYTTWFYEKMNSKDYMKLVKYTMIYAVLLTGLCVLLICISPEVMLILGSEKYKDAVSCGIPILAGGYFSQLTILPMNMEHYYKKTVYTAFSTSSALVINIALNYLLLPRFGYQFAAYTTVISYFFYFCFHLAVSIKVLKNKVLNYKLIWGNIMFLLLIAALAVFQLNSLPIRLALLMISALFLGIEILTIDKKFFQNLYHRFLFRHGTA